MATIGMLYICTGKYTVFWPEFYETFSRNFLPGCKKEYFIIPDPQTIAHEDDPAVNRIAQPAVTKLYGKESLITPAPLMGSEDFSWFGKDGIPYIYGFVASHNKDWDYMYGNHHEKYDVDETILHRGAAVAAQFAADYLAETAQQ